MGNGKNRNKQFYRAKARGLCIKAVAVIIREYTMIAADLRYNRKEISSFAEAVALLGEKDRSEKRLAELIEVLDDEMAQQRVPLNKRGTQLLKRVRNGSLPEGD